MSKQKVEKCVVDPADRVGVWEKCCYSIGFAGKDCFQTITNNYLMMFLMTVVGLNGGFIGTMMLGARIWDAINDPMLGSIADHTNSKFGRYRPYLLFSIPMAFIFALLFHTNGSFSDIGKWFTIPLFTYASVWR